MRTTSKLVCSALLTVGACGLALAPAVPGAAAGRPTAPATPAAYTVVAGDTLIGIASRMKVPVQSVLDANGLVLTSLILPGQRLLAPAGAVVPAPSAKAKAPAAPAATATAATAAGGRTTAPTPYTIVAGDYLYGIARRFAVPFASLLTTNQMTATSAILPGRQLIIPAGATTTPAAPTASANAAGPTTTAAPATTTTAPRVAKPIAPPRLEIAATGNAQIDAVLAFAKAQLGKPYVFAAAGPDTYDCSGLTAAAYAQAGVTLIRQSGMQSTQGTPVDFLNTPILAGDLVFTAGSATPGVISHVGIAINATQWIQATRPGAWVSVGAIPAKSKILAVRRYIG
jgi:cell wall-associated NlpC family hydrolase